MAGGLFDVIAAALPELYVLVPRTDGGWDPHTSYHRDGRMTGAFIHTGLTRARGSMFTHFTPADLVAILNIPRLQTLPNSFKILREYRLSVVALVFSR